MSDAVRSKPLLESFGYALDLEIQLKLGGTDFEIHTACAVASAIERLVQAFAAEMDPKLGSLKLRVSEGRHLVAEAEATAMRLRPTIGGDEFSRGHTAALVATVLWSSVIGLKACVEADFQALA